MAKGTSRWPNRSRDMIMPKCCRFGLALALLLVGRSLAYADAPLSAPAQAFSLPGDGGWDYITFDPSGDRVFIGRSDGVQVVDAEHGKQTATIGAPSGDHGVALVPAANRVFTSDAKESRLGIFALSTLQHLGTVPLPDEPDGLVTEAARGLVLAFIPDRQEAVVVDAASGKVTGKVDVGGEPEAGVADDAAAVFVTVRDTAEIVRLDVTAMTVNARWRTGCKRPGPIAMDSATRRLFVGCADRRLVVLDATDGHLIATVPTSDLTDAATFDPRTRTVALANGGGSVSLIEEKSADNYVLAGNIATPRGARTMGLDAKGGRLFTATADIASIDPPTAARPYPLLHPKPGTFRLIVLRPTAMR